MTWHATCDMRHAGKEVVKDRTAREGILANAKSERASEENRTVVPATRQQHTTNELDLSGRPTAHIITMESIHIQNPKDIPPIIPIRSRSRSRPLPSSGINNHLAPMLRHRSPALIGFRGRHRTGMFRTRHHRDRDRSIGTIFIGMSRGLECRLRLEMWLRLKGPDIDDGAAKQTDIRSLTHSHSLSLSLPSVWEISRYGHTQKSADRSHPTLLALASSTQDPGGVGSDGSGLRSHNLSGRCRLRGGGTFQTR